MIRDVYLYEMMCAEMESTLYCYCYTTTLYIDLEVEGKVEVM